MGGVAARILEDALHGVLDGREDILLEQQSSRSTLGNKDTPRVQARDQKVVELLGVKLPAGSFLKGISQIHDQNIKLLVGLEGER